MNPSTSQAVDALGGLGVIFFLFVLFWSLFCLLIPFLIWDIASNTKKSRIANERTLEAIIHLQTIILSQRRTAPPVSKSPSPPVSLPPRPYVPSAPRKRPGDATQPLHG